MSGDVIDAALVVASFQSDTSQEIAAMAQLASALEPLDIDSRRRALKWAGERFQYSGTLATSGDFALAVTRMMADLVKAVDLLEAALKRTKQEPSEHQAEVFAIVKRWRGGVTS